MIENIIIIGIGVVTIPVLYSVLKGIKLGFDYARKDLGLDSKKEVPKNYCKDCKHMTVNTSQADRWCSVYNKFVRYEGLNKNFDCLHFEPFEPSKYKNLNEE